MKRLFVLVWHPEMRPRDRSVEDTLLEQVREHCQGHQVLEAVMDTEIPALLAQANPSPDELVLIWEDESIKVRGLPDGLATLQIVFSLDRGTEHALDTIRRESMVFIDADQGGNPEGESIETL